MLSQEQFQRELIRALVILATLVVAAPWRTALGRGVVAFRPGIVAFFSAAGLFAVLYALELAFLSEFAPEGDAVFRTLTLVFLAGPTAESAKALAIAYPLRSKQLRKPYDAMRLARASAVGFVALETLVRTAGEPIDAAFWGRLTIGLATSIGLTGLWGFAIGRERRRTLGGRRFFSALVLVALFGSVTKGLLYGLGGAAIWVAAPLGIAAVIAWSFVRRDLLYPVERRAGDRRRRRPSLQEIEAALLSPAKHRLSFWSVIMGMLVTSGLLTTALIVAVVSGNVWAVDFSVLDNPKSSLTDAAGPLMLLGGSTLIAFPVAGFIVARASDRERVFEPALGILLALVGLVAFAAIITPLGILFALTLAPVGFALGFGGAWAGSARS